MRMTARLMDELFEFLQRQECGSTETVSKAPGAYGIRNCSNAARVALYETTSALVTLPSPKMGMVPLYIVSPLLQPLDGPCLSTGRGAHRTSVLACCCHNRSLQHGLGRYMQWAGSLWALDGAPTALAHQLPRAVDALQQFRPLLLGKHVLVRTDNTAAVSYINRLGDVRDAACHSSPAISSSEVTCSSNHCALYTYRGSLIEQPMRSHDSSRSPENGDSIPRRSG